MSTKALFDVSSWAGGKKILPQARKLKSQMKTSSHFGEGDSYADGGNGFYWR